jgi:hypothetical protein
MISKFLKLLYTFLFYLEIPALEFLSFLGEKGCSLHLILILHLIQ